jgi:hypothetical protein
MSLSSCSSLFEEPNNANKDKTQIDTPKPPEEDKPVANEDRFDYLKGLLNDDAIAQVKRLYSMYDDSVYKWLANLWDNDVGGFYYANSSRDYDGFLPDLESTRQVLAIVRTSGMVKGYGSDNDEAFVNAFPKDFRDKIVAFVKSCQDAETGYFVHKQWGSNVSSSRLGRDLDWAIELLNLFGEEPDYPTILDRVSGDVEASLVTNSVVSAVSSVSAVNQNDLPVHLRSEEAFKSYLDSFDFEANSHDYGHAVACQASLIKAAGLIDFACDYFDDLQEKIYNEQLSRGETPTGLWQPVVNYTSISGLYKIGGLYSTAGRSMKYLNECIDSAIQCIKSDENTPVIIYVFNPWAGMHKAVNAMKLAVNRGENYDLNATYAKIRAAAGELFEATVNKLSVFAKESGGFSYNQGNSANLTQGVTASLGLVEGDVNATNIAVNSISGLSFASMGIDRPDIWDNDDFSTFIEELRGVQHVDKIVLKREMLDFENYSEGEIPLGFAASAPSGVKEDPDGSDNMAMCFYSPASSGSASKYYINTGFTGEHSCVVFEADIKMTDFDDGTTHQVKFRGTRGNMYMLTLKMDNKSNTLTIGDCSHTSKGIVGELKIVLPADEWSKIRVEIYFGAEHELSNNGFIVKFFVNEEFFGYSNNYFGPTTANGNVDPVFGFEQIEVYGMNAPESSLWFDNVLFDATPDAFFEE